MRVPKGTIWDELLAVAASSARDIWAVGWHQDKGHSMTLHSDGQTWRVIPSPSPPLGGDENNPLVDVVARASSDAWAVGHSENSNNPGPRFASLIVHWNGKKWTVVRHARDESLSAIAARGRTLWTVGMKEGRDGLVHALALRYDGSSWHELKIPHLTFRASSLLDVTVTPAGDVWAIGDTNTAPSTHDTGKLGNFETLAFRIIGNRLVPDKDAPLSRYKAAGAGDGARLGGLGLAPIPQGGLLAIDAQHVYRRTTAGWRSVPPPAGNPSFTDVASGPNGPTWLTSEGRGHLLTRYDCH
jgi:hypothetical protein